jgi:lysophospholipase L1-like esterase
MCRRPVLLLPLLAVLRPDAAAAWSTAAPPGWPGAFVGSSTTAGVGASSRRHAYPEIAAGLLSARLGRRILPRVAGIPGAEGERIAEAALSMLDSCPRALVVQIGANAALRGEPPASLDAPLAKALSACERRRIPALVLGPQEAPAIAPERRAAVERVLEAGARRRRARWLARGPGIPIGPDGLHHDDAGHAELARRVAEALVPLLTPEKRPG